MFKSEGEFVQLEFIWESSLHFLENLNKILHMGIIVFLLSEIKNFWKKYFLPPFHLFYMFLQVCSPKSLIHIPDRCF